MSVPRLYDASGRAVALGASLGRGGEGEVFAIPSIPDSVAKVYHKPPNALRAEKIAAMASLAAQDLLRVAAWPTATLYANPGGQIAGLVMPLVEKHRELHVLYGPAQRRQEFPEATWGFLVHVALNTARAFATIHKAGHVLGDVNQKNVVVSKDATVRLIDCDSFQINARGKRFLCEVGVPDFTPPELHGQSFTGVLRSQNHDRFGLAVLIFHLLFMGRHPFVGVYSGSGEMPMERAIREGRYAYGRDAARHEMRPPPGAVTPITAVTSQIVALFEQAFAPRSAGERPTSEDWVRALTGLASDVRKCANHPGHMHVGTSCPWCAIERAGGPDFFVTLAFAGATHPGGTWDLDAFLRETAMIARPTPATLPQNLRTPPGKAGVTALSLTDAKTKTAANVLYVSAFGAGLAGLLANPVFFILTLLLWVAAHHTSEKAKNSPRARTLRDVLARAETAHRDALYTYVQTVERPAGLLNEKDRELQQAVAAYRNLDAELKAEREKLEKDQRKIQLNHRLERFYIRNAALSGIGPQLKHTLVSYGIETAADLSRAAIGRVPGFGPTRIKVLMDWKAAIEARFVFDPNKGVDPADVAQVQRKIAQKRKKLQSDIQKTAGELRSMSQRIRNVEPDLLKRLALTADHLATAKAQLGIT